MLSGEGMPERICLFSAHSLNSIPMIPLLADRLVESFEVSAFHINVQSYAQFGLRVKECAFAILPNRKALQQRSRWFNFRRYIWLIACFSRLLLSKKKTILYCTDDSCVKVLLVLMRLLPKKNNIRVLYHEFENVDEHNKLFVSGNGFTQKDFAKVDMVITPEKNRQSLLLKNLGKPGSAGMIMPNTCLPQTLSENKKHNIFGSIEPDAKVICHIGAIGERGHFFREFLEAMPNDYTLLLVGTITDEIKLIIQKFRQTKKIVESGQVNHEELRTIYPYVHYGLILYKGVDYNFEYCAPNKLYEFWSYGVPVIAHALGGLKDVFVYPCQGKLFDFVSPGFKNELYTWINGEKDVSAKKKLLALFSEKLELGIYSNQLITQLKEIKPEK